MGGGGGTLQARKAATAVRVHATVETNAPATASATVRKSRSTSEKAPLRSTCPSLDNNLCLSFVSDAVVDHQKNATQYTARQLQQKLKADYFAEHKKQPRTGQEALRDATAEFFVANKTQLQRLDCKIDLFVEMVQTGWLTQWTKENVAFGIDFFRTVPTS
jgi:hypothetical protein